MKTSGTSMESTAYTTGILLLGGLAAVASFRHVADAAIQFGQADPAWLPYALAGTPDLLAVLAGLSIRRRKRLGVSSIGPTALLVVAVIVLVAAQLVTAQPTPGGWFAAAWPAIAFLSVVALVETEPAAAKTSTAARKTLATAGQSARKPEPNGNSSVAKPAAPTGRTSKPAAGASEVSQLLPAGQAVAVALAQEGRPLNRGSLAEGLRQTGHAISTTRAAQLLAMLKTQTS